MKSTLTLSSHEPARDEPEQSMNDSTALLHVQWVIHADFLSILTHLVKAVALAWYLFVCMVVEVLNLFVGFPMATSLAVCIAVVLLWLQDPNSENTEE
jgi:hypothetical protein